MSAPVGAARLVALVARRDYLRAVRRRGFLFATLLLPISIAVGGLVVLLVGDTAGRNGTPPSLRLYVVNESTLRLPSPRRSAEYLRLVSRQEGTRRLESGETDALYVIPVDYVATGRIERITRPRGGLGLEDLERHELQEGMLADQLRDALLEGQPLADDMRERLRDPVAITERTTDGSAPETGIGVFARFVVPYAFSMLFVLSIFITSGYLLQSVTEEKENRVVEIVLSSVPAVVLMVGKIVGLGAAGLTQVAIWLATALAALPLLGLASLVAVGPTTIVLTLVYFVLGYLAYGAIFAAIGALAPGTREAQQYAGFFGFFAVVPLITSGTFLSDSGSPIITALALFPLTAPAAVLQLLAITSEPPWPLIVMSLALLCAFTVVAMVLSARVFRATLLLYGMRPSIRQIGRQMLARG